MVPALLATPSRLLAQHLTIGCSTGFMADQREQWPVLVARAAALSSFAVELSAISEPELPGLLDYLEQGPALPFHYVSIHAPSKQRQGDETYRIAQLAGVLHRVDAIIVHPDTIGDVRHYSPLGRRLVLENMDTRKTSGHRAADLLPLFEQLPSAGLCLDVAHAKDVDPTMAVAHELLDAFPGRLRQVHISSLDAEQHHVPLTPGDEELFAPVLDRCRDVPWILEAPPPS